MSIGHQKKKAVEKSVLNYFDSQSIWQLVVPRSQIPDEPCMTGVRFSRNHPARIDENNRNCSENSVRPDSIKISQLLLTTPPRRAPSPKNPCPLGGRCHAECRCEHEKVWRWLLLPAPGAAAS